MQKIMQINITCGRGSTGKLAQALYEASLQQGYEADFAYSAYTPTKPVAAAAPAETVVADEVIDASDAQEIEEGKEE